MKIFRMGRVVLRGEQTFSCYFKFSRPWWSFLNSKDFIFPGGYGHVDNYRQNRENGDERDNPPRKFPQDGFHQFIKGRVEGIYVYADKNENDGWHEIDLVYIEGMEDKKWMIEKDGNYLERLEREGKLKELEPVIYQLRESEHATGSIREWWAEKALLPEIYCFLVEKLLSYQQFFTYDEFRQATLHAIIEKANVDGAVTFCEFNDKCMEHAKSCYWYTVNYDIAARSHTVMYDFDVGYLSFHRMYNAICASPNIRRLNLSGINLSNDAFMVLICRLFKQRNDFTEIILTNTNLNDERLDYLLKALCFNLETRGIPLVENLVLIDNGITVLSNLMTFLKKYITQYIKQQQNMACVACMSPPPLRRIDLSNNNLQTVANRAPIDFSALQSYEQELDALGCTLNLTIDLTANALAVYRAPCPNNPDLKPNEYVCKYFISWPLVKVKSRVLPEKYVTKENGFVYLMCRNYKFPEHVSILVEMLTPLGQIALIRLELCVNESKEVIIKNTTFDVLKLFDPSFLDYVNIREFEVSTQLIKKLIDDVNQDILNCTIKHSLFGHNGHNCATWAAEKLRNIGLDIVDSMFPVVVVTGKDFKAANGGRIGVSQ